MSVVELARTTIVPLALRRSRAARSVEVRVLVDGVEQDRFVASRPDTLARALRPIGAYLERRSGRIEIVGVETSPWPFRRVTRTPLVPVLDDATVYLLGGP